MTVVKLIETFLSTILRHDLLPTGDSTLVVGVSGGTDLLALLHLLIAVCERLNVALHSATLDHGLRGEAGAADARFVVETARSWGVAVTAGYADVRALAAERGLGIEAAARIARYDFLASVAAEVGADRVAVAHHADDQVETVLLHLLRGSGPGGLAGMGYRAPLPGDAQRTLIRPLLDVTRADLEAYCRAHDLHPRHDASNEDTSYTRNRLRRETLPYLRQLAPRFDRGLLQLAEIAGLEDDFADQALHAAVDPDLQREEGRISLSHATFRGLHSALQRRFVVWAARELGADGVGYVHVTTAVRLALESEVGARAELGGGVQLRVHYQTVSIERADAPLTDASPLLAANAEVPVTIPGLTLLDGWSLESWLPPHEQGTLRLAIPERASVALRGRREGDRFAPIGLNGHIQKINKWMIDHKIPRDLRDRVPLLTVDGEIAGILWYGGTVSERFAVKADSAQVVYFRLNRATEAN